MRTRRRRLACGSIVAANRWRQFCQPRVTQASEANPAHNNATAWVLYRFQAWPQPQSLRPGACVELAADDNRQPVWTSAAIAARRLRANSIWLAPRPNEKSARRRRLDNWPLRLAGRSGSPSWRGAAFTFALLQLTGERSGWRALIMGRRRASFLRQSRRPSQPASLSEPIMGKSSQLELIWNWRASGESVV